MPVVVGAFLINDGPAGVAFRAVSHQVSILGFGTGCSISVFICFPCVLCVKAVNVSCRAYQLEFLVTRLARVSRARS